MSIIQTIREKGAWVLIGAIAVALIAFIVQDSFHSMNMFSDIPTEMGKVNGVKIDATEFDERYRRAEEMYRQQGFPLNDMMRTNIREGIWNEYVDDAILTEKYESLGIAVSDKELSDILYGENPPPDLRQQFTDPNTGQYDPNAAYQQIQELRKQRNTPQYASFFQQYLPALSKNRQKEKYLSLLRTSVYIPKWLVERINSDNSQQAAVRLVNVPYSTVPDSAVTVTDAAIRQYVEAHKDEYKQEDSRSIEYVVFDASATSADSAEIRSQMEAVREEFATIPADDMEAFFMRNGSEMPYMDAFELRSKIRSEHLDSIVSLQPQEVFGPYVEGGNYIMARLVDKRVMPDSVKVRHILIRTADQGRITLDDSTAKQRIDSVALAIRRGADFNQMVQQYSDDQGSLQTGGEYDFTSSQFAGISKEFAEVAFYGLAGDNRIVKVENPAYSGYHYIEVLRQKDFEPAFKIAEFAKAIVPSQETLTRENGLAAQFAAESRDRKSFDDNARKNNYNKLIATDIQPLDAMVTGLGSSREIVKWVFEAKQGTVSETPFQVDDKFVVPAVTRIYKAGTMDVERARPLVESIVRNQEKAKKIAATIGTPASIEAAAEATDRELITLDSLRFNAMFIPNVGQEPKVVGAAFNPDFQSKPSGPISGNGGVFVVKIDNISAAANPEVDIEAQQQQMRTNRERIFSDPRVITEVLKKNVKIVDNRHFFF